MLYSTHFLRSRRYGLFWILFCVLLVMMPVPVHAAAGQLDPTFGDGGKVVTHVGTGEDGRIQAIIIQPDGKLVVAGYAFTDFNAEDFVVVRYNPDGSLDSSFDGDGQVFTDFRGHDVANTLLLQPDGKLVVAGGTYIGGDTNFALARYNADGSLDNSFDSDGKVIINVGFDEQIHALVLQPDGKLVTAGYVRTSSSVDFILVRYNADGSLDSSFEDDGKVFTDLGGDDEAFALVLQSDGKLVAAGITRIGINSDLALARYNPDGSLDSSFDGDGKVFTDLGSNEYLVDLLLQPDGKLVASGGIPTGSTFDGLLVRYNADGSLDSSFDGDGLRLTDLGDVAAALVRQPDGKLVTAGYTSAGAGFDFVLVRCNADGSLDNSFGNDGKIFTNFGGYDLAFALVLQPDGKLVAAGQTGFSFALARYLGDGNTAPAAVDDSYNVGVNSALNVAAPGVLSNDSAADGDVLTAALVSGPSNGRLTLNADGAFTYTPNPGFSGVDRFTYQAHAGQATSTVATVTITVPTATERIDLLSGSIRQLMTTGVLNQGQGNALLTKLTNARREVARCKMKQARKMLEAFNKHATDLLAAGVLTPEVGQPLIAAANVIMAQVQADACITGVNAEEDAADFTLYLPYVRR